MATHDSIAEFLKRAFLRIWAEKVKFFLVFFCVLLISYGFLYLIDFIPEKPDANSESGIAVATDTESRPQDAPIVAPGGEGVAAGVEGDDVAPNITEIANASALPTRIVIGELELDVPVLNPHSRAIADLDAALLEGAVRYPDSADFVNTGTMVIFGHSSYLPVIRNKNYKAFNGIQKLSWGDRIELYSADAQYIYRVTKVYETKASEQSLTLDSSAQKLILITCDSFGSKDDRFVVEAELIKNTAV